MQDARQRRPSLLEKAGFFRTFTIAHHHTNINMADDRPASPTPEEREKLDKEAKAKEIAEQAKLPYKWTQTIGDVDITAPIPANIKAKDLDVKITKSSIKAGIKGQEPIIDVCLCALSILNCHADTDIKGSTSTQYPRGRIRVDA